MAKIANVALTDTFDTFRVRSNIGYDRLSQFAINNSSLYANTVTANTSFTSKGTTNLGDSTGDLTTIAGRTTIGTNLAVSGNTSSNKITVTSLLTSSGNTTLTGAATMIAAPVFSSATASQAMFTDGSKALVSNAITGTGNVVMSASPTLTGTIAAASQTLSGTLGVTGATTLSAALTYGGVTLANSVTGTGSMVLATSPTLTTPALGTPASGVLSSCTVDGTDAVGFRNIPVNSQTAAYGLVLADSGKCILHPSSDATARTFTIPANSSVAYAIGTAITFINMTSQVVTIAITTDTMYLSSAGTTGSRSLAQYGSATAIKITSTNWLISGSGLT